MGSDRAPRRPGADPRPQLADRARWIGDGGGDLSAPRAGRGEGRDPDRSRRACLHRRGAASACAERRGDRVGAPRPGAGTMSSRPLEHPIIDRTALARLVLDLPKGQTPGLARLVEELHLDVMPAHAALDDARATAMVFRALIALARESLGWNTVGDVLAALPRPLVDRTAPSRRASAGGRAQGARGPTAPPRSAAPAATPRATSRAPSGRRGRSSRRRRSGSSGSPGGSPA